MNICLNYDYNLYPYTTASYIDMAMVRRQGVKLFTRTDHHKDKMDLVLNIEPVGELLHIPGVPCHYWEIDNHLIQGREVEYYEKADTLWIAQKNFMGFYLKYPTKWLPLGFDENMHRPFKEEKEVYDIGLLGNDTYPYRRRLLDQLSQHYKVLRGNSQPGIPYSKKLSTCKMIFNCSMDNDINMRVFEAMGIGKLLMTDRIQGIDEIITEGEHYAGYSSFKELKQNVDYYLDRRCYRESIARQAREYGLKKHTYGHRLDVIIEEARRQKNGNI